MQIIAPHSFEILFVIKAMAKSRTCGIVTGKDAMSRAPRATKRVLETAEIVPSGPTLTDAPLQNMEPATRNLLMTHASPPEFQVHWSLVPSDDAAELVPPGCRLLAIWPAQ